VQDFWARRGDLSAGEKVCPIARLNSTRARVQFSSNRDDSSFGDTSQTAVDAAAQPPTRCNLGLLGPGALVYWIAGLFGGHGRAETDYREGLCPENRKSDTSRPQSASVGSSASTQQRDKASTHGAQSLGPAARKPLQAGITGGYGLNIAP
jgi:hypothetical protein